MMPVKIQSKKSERIAQMLISRKLITIRNINLVDHKIM